MLNELLGPFITIFTLNTTRLGYRARVFPSPVTEKPAEQPPVSLSHSWHASAGHLHPPVDSPQIDSPRKLLSPSCALTTRCAQLSHCLLPGMHESPVSSLSSRKLLPREQSSSYTPAPPVDERDTERVGQNRFSFQRLHLVCAHSSHLWT